MSTRHRQPRVGPSPAASRCVSCPKLSHAGICAAPLPLSGPLPFLGANGFPSSFQGVLYEITKCLARGCASSASRSHRPTGPQSSRPGPLGHRGAPHTCRHTCGAHLRAHLRAHLWAHLRGTPVGTPAGTPGGTVAGTRRKTLQAAVNLIVSPAEAAPWAVERPRRRLQTRPSVYLLVAPFIKMLTAGVCVYRWETPVHPVLGRNLPGSWQRALLCSDGDEEHVPISTTTPTSHGGWEIPDSGREVQGPAPGSLAPGP